MRDLPDELLHAWAAGLLEPGDTLGVERLVAARPDLRRRAAALRAWRADALGSGGARLSVAPSQVLDAGGVGEDEVLHLDVHAPGELRPVVLADGVVVHPATARRFVPLSALGRAGDAVRLDVVVPRATREVLVLLAPADAAFEGAWDALRADAEAGRAPGWRIGRG